MQDRRWTIATLLGLLVCSGPGRADPPLDRKSDLGRPNIVYILADDLGYGDVHCLNPEGKIPTPNLDRFASQGMAFTDAHSGSAVCTPTRYGILTGRYAWRTRLPRGVLGGYSSPLIEPGRMTVASLLKGQGYRTACFGKWHLGLDWPTRDGLPAGFGDAIEPLGDVGRVDYAGTIGRGPTALGFDHFYGISASLDMPPFVFIEDDHCDGVPTTEKTFLRKGAATEDFEAVNVLPIVVEEAVAFIDARAGEADKAPFFLYLPLNAPHTPIVPADAFEGQSGINPYADYVMQVDAAVGRVLRAIEDRGLTGSTLVIFTSDNGCSPAADFRTLAEHGHHPSGPYRGAKADIYEGGHRIPFLVRWPDRVKPGTRCEDTVCLTDLMATCAEILGVSLPDDAGEDSVSLLPDLLGTASGPVREATVHHSINGSFAIRQGNWKLCLCPGSGGWSVPRPGREQIKDLPPVQLFDLSRDPGERENLTEEHPEVVTRLRALLEKYIAEGRSTPGLGQHNDRKVLIRSALILRSPFRRVRH